jgi:hypothetical protein
MTLYIKQYERFILVEHPVCCARGKGLIDFNYFPLMTFLALHGCLIAPLTDIDNYVV